METFPVLPIWAKIYWIETLILFKTSLLWPWSMIVPFLVLEIGSWWTPIHLIKPIKPNSAQLDSIHFNGRRNRVEWGIRISCTLRMKSLRWDRYEGLLAGSKITGKSATRRKFSSTLTSFTKIGPTFVGQFYTSMARKLRCLSSQIVKCPPHTTTIPHPPKSQGPQQVGYILQKCTWDKYTWERVFKPSYTFSSI